ncbi:cAMP-regulated D2 protein-like [Ostrea edulis]|uniref:cAMP-regulated D2 protein-like n=1 Tax=Ostrea edulis TaxID=37623 RepID=UPI0024AFBB07|nr:cAMP-regulated D2 protein-like [Ostrea edulis]
MTNEMRIASCVLASLAGLQLCHGFVLPTHNVRRTESGSVRGIITTQGQSYLGIPYGKASRFSHSVAFGAWNGIRSAEKYGPQCYQPLALCQISPESCNKEMSEDCLTLNVYTPRRAKYPSGDDSCNWKHKYPVLVWIHGGYYQAYSAGSPYYNGLDLASAAGIIVVTLNYRLGPLGFLKIPGVEESGNYGFYDQRLALEWVKRNIHYFGGNPKKVTLGGESAGAHATLFHMMMPRSQPLFQRAILMSAPGIEVPTSDDSTKTAVALMSSLKCDLKDNAIKCLREKSVHDITALSLQLPAPQNFLHTFQRFGVYIDGLEITESFFNNSNSKHKFGDKPLLIGTSEYEALRLVYNTLKQPIPLPAFSAVVSQWRPAIVQETQRLYMASPSSSMDIRPEISNLLTDALFTCPARFLAGRIASESNVWVYVFNHPNFDTYNTPLSCDDRACHVDDFPYLFLHPKLVSGVPDKYFPQLSKLMVEYFGNFVKRANPNSRKMRPVWLRHKRELVSEKMKEKRKWKLPLSDDFTLELRYPDPRMIQHYRRDRCDYWDKVGYRKE